VNIEQALKRRLAKPESVRGVDLVCLHPEDFQELCDALESRGIRRVAGVLRMTAGGWVVRVAADATVARGAFALRFRSFAE
jgi:hypothetical protein